ncbi:MFS transporter [Levilactobacillus namurensis]|uniref:MFS transporter n=1 Tax=Levilactobacillus namurensis TaxID=380393 RepID=UPI000464DA98|nr:MFS transporter [Levilactobacillus namurensis]
MSNKNIILFSQFINEFGSGFSRIALIILVTDWFHNPIYVGILTFGVFVPEILLAAPVGYFVDKKSHLKRLLVQSSLASAISVIAIFLCVYFKVKSFALLVIGAIIYDIFSGFFDPIIVKLTVRLFEKGDYNKINAAISTARTSAGLFSGVLVTVFTGFVPIKYLFLFDFLSYIVISLVLLGLNGHREVNRPLNDSAGEEYKSNIWNSFGFVKQLLHDFPPLVPVLVTALLFNILLAPNSVYFAQISGEVFRNVKLIGVMDSFFSMGFLIGSVIYRLISEWVNIHTFLQIAIVQVPISFLLFGESQNIVITLLGLLLLGAALPFFNISSKTVLQRVIPESRLATVSNSYFSLINLTQPIGLLGIPILLNLSGIRRFSLVAGIAYLGVTLMILATGKISTALD